MIETGQSMQISGILICGKVSLLSAESLEQLAQNYRVLVTGRGDLQSRMDRIHIYDAEPDDEKFGQLFDAWQIDAVIYISGYADGGSGLKNEMAMLDRIMDCCKNNTVSKLIVLSSLESINFQAGYGIDGEIVKRKFASGKALAAAAFEDMIRYYAKDIDQRTIILRLPYIVTDTKNGSFISDLFSALLTETPITFPYSKENRVDILSAEDLAELLIDVLEEDMDSSASYNVSSGYHYTWGELEETLQGIAPGTSITYLNGINFISVQSFPIELKRKYGFLPMDNCLEQLPLYYQAYKDRIAEKDGLLKKCWKVMSGFAEKHLLGYIELLVFFILVQFLMKAAGQNVYFQYVDLRLFFVLLMGSVHGMQVGVFAGILECVSLFLDYRATGINGTMLFYNIENWLPFIVYLVTGSVTGYMRSLSAKKIQFQKEENDLLRDRYLFLNDVYHGAIENKTEYRRQILGYQDSFGTIYEAVSKLNNDEPGDIFMNGIQVLENTLKNHSIAIYAIDKGQHFGRLIACSGDVLSKLNKSIDLDRMPEIISTVTSGEIFRNTELDEGLPMYAYGILEDNNLSLMVTLYEAGPDQTSLYYLNLFNILCGLMRFSFLRAVQYQRAIEQKKYYPDTQVLFASYFEAILRQQQKLARNGMASFVLLRFESKDVKQISEKLRGMIRSRDVMGCDDEGNIYLILTQMAEENVHIVTERLDKKEIVYTIMPGGRI